ncbi:MAG: hypothetical protein VW397_08915 [Candidatus Margulisiibacteriota bacterium]
MFQIGKNIGSIGNRVIKNSSLLYRHAYTTKITSLDSPGAKCPHYNITAEYTIPAPDSILSKLVIDSSVIKNITDRCWNPNNTETSYQPNYMRLIPFKLSKKDQNVVDQMSDLAYFGADKMHQNTFSHGLKSIDGGHFYNVLFQTVHDYLRETNDDLKTEKARALNDAFIAIGWLEKYWLFEGFYTKNKANYVVPEVISKPYSLLAVLFGNQAEFLYYGHYVGASCSNMVEMREMMKTVDFANSDSIVGWLKSFDSLYDFQSIYNVKLDGEDPDLVLQSEQTFRFIHLAMEMVFSRDIPKIYDLIENIFLKAGIEQESLILDFLKLLHKTEVDMHAVFKTLPLVSLTKHYNPFVRPFIAGTFGSNCGTVFHRNGKFFEGCGNDSHMDVKTAFLYRGKWKQHVGQTGAQTSARVIMDMLSFLGTNALQKPVDESLMTAIMADNQGAILSFINQWEGDPLTLQLTLFRAICRPPNQNYQIAQAFEKSKELIPMIYKSYDATFQLAQVQLDGIRHRTLHFNYVHSYINGHAAPTSQKRTDATGGTKTYKFLPNLTEQMVEQASKSLDNLKKLQIEQGKPSSDLETLTKELRLLQTQSNQIKQKTIAIAKHEAQTI